MLLPVTNVRVVPRDQLIPNDYNPNIVLAANLDLLERSILTNGWTLPIVVRPDMTIIDGYHRWTVAGREPLKTKLRGMVPIVIVQHQEEAQNIYGTITHNRARGVHQLGPMKGIIKRLMDGGKTIPEIGTQLGMRPEEVFRLCDISRDDFLDMLANHSTQYSEAKLFVNV